MSKTNKITKLYKIPKGSKLKVETNRAKEEIVTFHRIDGMYSYITADNDGEVLHLHNSTPLIKENGYYKIYKNK